MKKKETWEKISWDGNPDLKYECFRKKFGKGHVSVGIGTFDMICFSFGANSDWSMSSTRWNGADKPPITEEQAMKLVDKANGNCDKYCVLRKKTYEI